MCKVVFVDLIIHGEGAHPCHSPHCNTAPNSVCIPKLNWAGEPQVSSLPVHRFRCIREEEKIGGHWKEKKREAGRGHRDLGHVMDATGACVVEQWTGICLFVYLSLATPDLLC